MRVLDFWFDFASTYSYPAALRIRALAAEVNVIPRFRPFLLGPIFKAQGWDTSPFNLYPSKGRYMWRDLERQCAEFALPFRRPDPFPQNSLMAMRVALVGLNEGWGEDFCIAVFRAEFGDGRQIDNADNLADILAGLNIDAKSALETAQSDQNKLALRRQTEEAQRLGVFGAPSFTAADGELFWGNDRLAQALHWTARNKASAPLDQA